MVYRIGEQGAALEGVTNPDTTVSGLGAAGYLQAAIADAIANGQSNASASRLGAQGRIYAIAGGGNISFGLPGGSTWSPSALFASSEVGVWYDPSDLSTMFQNSNGTTAVAVGDPVGYIADKSGNGFHATQATAASRPVLRQAAGGLYYLEFDGIDDSLATASIDFSATDKVSIWAGMRKLSDAAAGTLCELSQFWAGNAGAFIIGAPYDTTNEFGAGSRGDAAATIDQVAKVNSATWASPITVVASSTHDISGDSSTLRLNASDINAVTVDQGGGNFGNYPLYIGRRGAGSNPANIHLYSMIIRGALSDAAEISNAEAYVNGKTGAY